MKFHELKASWRRTRQSAMFFGIFATGVKVGANLLLLPVLLTKLPEADLALWWQFGALGGFANLADFGFGATIARVYSYLWAGAEDFDAEGLRPPPVSREPNLPRIRQLSATVGYFYWLLAIAATLVIAVIGTFLLRKTVAAVADPQLAWMAWAGQVFLIGFGLGTSRWMLACQGLGRVRDVQAAYLFGGLTYVALATVLLLNGWGLLGLLAATFAREVIARSYCRWVYYAAVPNVSALHVKADKEILKRLWPNASKLGVLSIGYFLLSNGSVLICGQLKDVKVTASFGLTAQIGQFLMNFAALWLAVKWPTISMFRLQGRLQEMSILFARRLALTMGTYVVLAALVALAGNWLLALKGTQTRLLPAPLLIFYFVYLAQQLFYVQFGALAYSENVVPFFKISIFTGVGMFCLSFLLTWKFGLWGMLLAPLIVESACSSWYTVRRGFRGQPLTARQLFRAALTGQVK